MGSFQFVGEGAAICEEASGWYHSYDSSYSNPFAALGSFNTILIRCAYQQWIPIGICWR
jgi:hypothetical protein